jgi:hypothetical protein
MKAHARKIKKARKMRTALEIKLGGSGASEKTAKLIVNNLKKI